MRNCSGVNEVTQRGERVKLSRPNAVPTNQKTSSNALSTLTSSWFCSFDDVSLGPLPPIATIKSTQLDNIHGIFALLKFGDFQGKARKFKNLLRFCALFSKTKRFGARDFWPKLWKRPTISGSIIETKILVREGLHSCSGRSGKVLGNVDFKDRRKVFCYLVKTKHCIRDGNIFREVRPFFKFSKFHNFFGLNDAQRPNFDNFREKKTLNPRKIEKKTASNSKKLHSVFAARTRDGNRRPSCGRVTHCGCCL